MKALFIDITECTVAVFLRQANGGSVEHMSFEVRKNLNCYDKFSNNPAKYQAAIINDLLNPLCRCAAGKKTGVYVGKVAVRNGGSFDIVTKQLRSFCHDSERNDSGRREII